MTRVLVVDDEPSVLRLTSEILARAGYEVDRAAGPEQALEALTTHTALAVCDVQLAGASGLELARELRERRPGLPILLVSGAPLETDTADPLLVKPFTHADLLAAVAAAMP